MRTKTATINDCVKYLRVVVTDNNEIQKQYAIAPDKAGNKRVV